MNIAVIGRLIPDQPLRTVRQHVAVHAGPLPLPRPRRRWSRCTQALALSTAFALLVGCSNTVGTGNTGYITGTGVPTEVKAVDRGEPIELRGPDLEGNTINLAAMRGTPVVVNVWASWCGPCIAEQPDLNEAAALLGDDAQFVGLNVRDASREDAAAFVRKFEVDFPSIYSSDGTALLAFAGTLGPRSIPSTVVLDAEGRIAASVQGRIPSVLTLVQLAKDADG